MKRFKSFLVLLTLSSDCVDRWSLSDLTEAVEDDIMNEQQLVEAIKKMKSESPSRKFTESVDLAINLRDVNLQDPSNRFQIEVRLPSPLTKEMKICVLAEGAQLVEAQSSGVSRVIDKEELDNISRNPKVAKKIAQEYDFFIASAPLMPIIGRNLGKYLGPRGKMPKPVPPTASITSIIDNVKQIVQVRLRQAPVIHVKVGNSDMELDHLRENVFAVVKAIENKLEKGEFNIRSLFIKTTMGPAIKIR